MNPSPKTAQGKCVCVWGGGGGGVIWVYCTICIISFWKVRTDGRLVTRTSQVTATEKLSFEILMFILFTDALPPLLEKLQQEGAHPSMEKCLDDLISLIDERCKFFGANFCLFIRKEKNCLLIYLVHCLGFCFLIEAIEYFNGQSFTCSLIAFCKMIFTESCYFQ